MIIRLALIVIITLSIIAAVLLARRLGRIEGIEAERWSNERLAERLWEMRKMGEKRNA